MRILFTVLPQKSTFLYLVPMAWALRTAGHEVVVASTPDFTDTITQAGLTAVPAGRPTGDGRMLVARGVTPEVVEKYRAGLPPPYDIVNDPGNATWQDTLEACAGALESLKFEMFPMLGGLVNFARQWQPDLVVWHPFTLCGPIAAKACGAAHARMLFSVDVFAETRNQFLRLKAEQPAEKQEDPYADWFSAYGRKYGFEFTEDMVTGQFTIDQFPRSLQMVADGVDYVRTQYVPYGGPAIVPKWLQAPPERPRVALTLGSTATDVYNGYTVPLIDILTALSELDIELVATVAESEQHKLGAVPANVRLVPYVPWHAIVPTCSAVIHHAGLATLATTARHPVPQLALHYHFDQPLLGRMLAEQGAGLEIHASKVTGDNVRDSVRRLLTQPVFGERATALRDEIFALPTPNDIVGRIEELTVKYRTR
ncbi:glycosyltransferase (activator-dependent family) [Kibdelosporangium banguiense]|uniref:Glycosyltransferase (Activator-dependent family) n=1 Tax=Kibdelosporangium banguiense TaxID=1365924 RepID=A0ABS4TXF7_9PSEU|nr:activator-dependent family glycosyltransferase [Kibdelosporangium banguiense]MBP2329082.1 glycosyltransferase (activator-dependent family) [Kibdelosporangium banguiense]